MLPIVFRGSLAGFRVSMSLSLLDIKKVAISFLLCIFTYCLFGEIYLYFKIQHSSGILPLSDPNVTLPCYPSPYCHVDMKGLLLDYPNFYIHHPLSATLHELINFKETFSFVSANFITIMHVFLALIAAKCVANESITYRRIGVGLIVVRNFLDAFDGTVARARRPPINSYQNVGTIGYYVDGLADAIGYAFLYIACSIFMYRRYTVRGKSLSCSPLPVVIGKENNLEAEPWIPSSPSNSYKISTRGCILQPFLCSIQSILCSISWNRYIALYTKYLENPTAPPERLNFQSHVVKSSIMWVVILLWRLFNPHSMVDMLLIAIFFDKMLEFFRCIKFIGFLLIITSVCFAEMHLNDIDMYLSSKWK